MKKLLLLILGIYLFGFSLFNSKKPKVVIYINENNEFNKIVKFTINKLNKENNFKFITSDNNAILSLSEENQFYTNQVKFIDGLNADPLLKKDAIYNIFTIKYINNYLIIKGIKYIKNEKAYRLHLKLKVNDKTKLAKDIYKLIVFFVNSKIPDIKTVNRNIITPFVLKQKNKEKVIFYTNKKVVLNNALEENIKLAKKLKLIFSNDNGETAKEYCNLLDKDVANKLFSNDDDITFEDYLNIINYKDGFKIYTFKNPKTNKKNFKCIGKETTNSLDFNDYVLTKLGLIKKEESPYENTTNLKIDGVYGYFYNKYLYKLNINHTLKYLNKKVLNEINYVDTTFDGITFASDDKYIYKIIKNKVVKKLKLPSIKNITCISMNRVIVSTNDGKIYIFDKNLKTANTILPIGIFFYKFKDDIDKIIGYNSNGYKYIFLKNKFLGEK